MPQRSHRATIVESAEALLRRKGLASASIADITAAAGVPKGSFYNHFESKDALVAELVGRCWRAIDVSNLKGEGSPTERLRAHFAACSATLIRTEADFGCLLGTAAGEARTVDTSVGQAVRTGIEFWSTAVAATIAEAQEAGELRTDQSADELAALLIELFEGAVLLAKVTGDYDAPLRHVDMTLATLRQS